MGIAGSPSQSSTLVADSQLSAELQDSEISQYTFLPEHGIEIPSLKTMEVTLRFAHMLGLADDLVNLDINRTLDLSRSPVSLEDLPASDGSTALVASLSRFRRYSLAIGADQTYLPLQPARPSETANRAWPHGYCTSNTCF